MHIEILVEDSSGAKLVTNVLPAVIGLYDVTWRVIAYKGIGRIPKDLGDKSDPAKRALLNELPRILRGYGNTPGMDAVIVVIDSDRRDCKDFLAELKAVVDQCSPVPPTTLLRLAIEEVEAWYFGDRQALLEAYPHAKKAVLDRYVQDGVCDTWELLADAIYPGGSVAIKRAGWPLPGQVKHDWADRISPKMNVEQNQSPSFCKFRDGVRRLVS